MAFLTGRRFQLREPGRVEPRWDCLGSGSRPNFAASLGYLRGVNPAGCRPQATSERRCQQLCPDLADKTACLSTCQTVVRDRTNDGSSGGTFLPSRGRAITGPAFCASSSAGRASASQAEGRGSEPRLALTVVMGTLGGFPNPPAHWLRRAKARLRLRDRSSVRRGHELALGFAQDAPPVGIVRHGSHGLAIHADGVADAAHPAQEIAVVDEGLVAAVAVVA